MGQKCPNPEVWWEKESRCDAKQVRGVSRPGEQVQQDHCSTYGLDHYARAREGTQKVLPCHWEVTVHPDGFESSAVNAPEMASLRNQQLVSNMRDTTRR